MPRTDTTFPTAARTTAVASVFVVTTCVPPSALADACNAPEELVRSIWYEYKALSQRLDCGDDCFDQPQAHEKVIKGLVNQWDSRGWSTFGPRRLDIGDPQSGNVVATRKFVSMPVNGALEMTIRKEGGRAQTDVAVCKYAKEYVDGDTVWQLNVGGGTGTIGNVWTNRFADAAGHIFVVTLKAGPGLQSMEYVLETSVDAPEPTANRDQGNDGAASVTLEPGTDRPGADYRNFDIGANDPTLCASACAYDSNCKAYAYAPAGYWEGSNAQCWLKDSIPERTANEQLVSGVRWPDYVSAGTPVTREYNINRRGADYRNFNLASEDPQACAQACAEDTKCKAYTYAPAGHWEGSPPQCWLKDSVPPRTEVADLVSGVRLE